MNLARGGTGSGAEEERERLLREIAEADLRTIAQVDFPVFEASVPAPAVPVLNGWERAGGRVVRVVLVRESADAGEAGEAGGAGPVAWVRVETGVREPGWSSLAFLLDEELGRDAPGATGGSVPEAGAAAGAPAREYRAGIAVDGRELPFRVREQAGVWAARIVQEADRAPLLRHGSEPVWITVVGRGVPVTGLELRTVEDLAAYARGRVGRIRERMAARGRVPSPAPAAEAKDPPPSPPELGMDAHRRLIELSVRHALELRARVDAGQEPPRFPPGRAELWESAVRQQMRLASESREDANAAVTALVNQMIRLAERTDWFPHGEGARTALEESVRYAVFASEVSSAEAQRAWTEVWSGGPPSGLPSSGPPPRASAVHGGTARPSASGDRELHPDESAWLRAWTRWHDRVSARGR